MLHEKLTEEELETKWKGDDRTPFSVTKNWTRAGSGKPCCITHKEVACEECFNWGGKILTEIQGGGKKARKSTRRSRDKSTRLEWLIPSIFSHTHKHTHTLNKWNLLPMVAFQIPTERLFFFFFFVLDCPCGAKIFLLASFLLLLSFPLVALWTAHEYDDGTDFGH